MILAADIGGTNCRFALYEKKEDVKNRVEPNSQRLEMSHYNREKGWEEAIDTFLSAQGISNPKQDIETVCFAMAGPVEEKEKDNRSCRLTNVEKGWSISEHELRVKFEHEGGKALIINDMEAIAYAIPLMKEEDMVLLNRDKSEEKIGNRGLIAAGTGLGELAMVWDRQRKEYLPSPSEGGHVNFAQRNEDEQKLWEFLVKVDQLDCVSYEQVISGTGLVRIYRALCREAGRGDDNPVITQQQQGLNPARYITDSALNESDEISVKTLKLFMQIFGAEAGNVALKYLAVNGMFIGGGISPKIWNEGKGKAFFDIFLEAFQRKEDRFAEMNARIPIKLLLNQDIGLLGAGWCVAKRLM